MTGERTPELPANRALCDGWQKMLHLFSIFCQPSQDICADYLDLMRLVFLTTPERIVGAPCSKKILERADPPNGVRECAQLCTVQHYTPRRLTKITPNQLFLILLTIPVQLIPFCAKLAAVQTKAIPSKHYWSSPQEMTILCLRRWIVSSHHSRSVGSSQIIMGSWRFG
eukprot:COSAG03_NODE_8144_length_832_cov_2.675307_1_plen_169_part_00